MGDLFRQAGASLLDLLFPTACISCGRAGSLLCDGCAQQTPPAPRPLCLRCGQPGVSGLCPRCAASPDDPVDMARAAALHEEPLRSAIHALKYENTPALAPLLARYLVAALDHPEWTPILPNLCAVCPVPLHPARLAQRGYNQSALLAANLCRVLGFPHHPEWLERSRDTPPQVGLNAVQRRVNVADSFVARPDVAGAVLLLVDDVYTTGATLRACALAARASGARAVYAITLARPLLAPADGATVP